jgi:hypothetical protein
VRALELELARKAKPIARAKLEEREKPGKTRDLLTGLLVFLAFRGPIPGTAIFGRPVRPGHVFLRGGDARRDYSSSGWPAS